MSKTDREQKVREVRPYNQASETIHAGLGRISSRIRLSLSLRIAAHYCARLIRTSLVTMIIISLALAVGCVPTVRSLITRVTAQEPDLEDGVYSQMIIQDARAEAVLITREEPENFGVRVAEWARTLVSGGKVWRPVLLIASDHGETGNAVLLTLDLKEVSFIWFGVLAGVIVTDILRMLSFLRRRKVLDKKVLSPIRDITDIARTLSAANLSNRINVAGMKSELQDLAEVINSMLDRIERSYISQKQFVSDASHELRTPIAVIQGYADMLRRWGKDDPEVLNEGIEAISQETVAMKVLVENLLFLARHDKNTLMLEVSRFDAAEVLQEVCQEAGMVSSDHRFDIVTCESAPINADRGMVKQVLRILVDNAVKYAPKDSVIQLGVRKTGEEGCTLTVTDHGCGIPEEELPRIFERFYRADAARNSETGGHGLGLSIARIIVVAHGGKIHVRSKVGEGTTFEIVLPGMGNNPEAA
ncbi:MAG: HAMP domain-containing histidine kinase [Clostridiales bacterium]|nr:HAMP domain-containing histidine kinase [Clostridiales bacterium]